MNLSSKLKFSISGLFKKTALAFMVFAIFLPVFFSGVASGADVKLESPVVAKTIPELICLATNFLAEVLMPPLAVILILWAGLLYLTASGKPDVVSKANTVLISTVFGIAILILAPALIALAVNVVGTPVNAPVGVNISDVCSVNASSAAITNSLINLINWFSWFIAAASVAMGMYSGFLFMTSRGDPQRSKKATTAIVFTIIGAAISILAFSIISIIEVFIK